MSRSLPLLLTAFLTQLVPTVVAQTPTANAGPLQRHYTEGAISHYRMTGDNDGWKYSVQAAVTVKRDKNGRYYEEIGWSDFNSNGRQSLNPASLAQRQTVSLDDPGSYMTVPNLAAIQPFLIGPITDTLTIYSDLLLAMQAKLEPAKQTAYVPGASSNSWADGQHVLLGEDAVDFSLKVESVNSAEHSETFLIQHVPPPALRVKLPAKWMQQQSSDKPYNWVQVSRQSDTFVAETGTETFDVRLTVDTRDGHILSASIHNPVVLTSRTCTDRDLTQCGPTTPKTILREITFKLIP